MQATERQRPRWSLFFQKQCSALFEIGLGAISEDRQEPWQIGLKPHAALVNVNVTFDHLSERAHGKYHAIARPRSFNRGQLIGGKCSLRLRETRLQATRGFGLAHAVGDGDDEWDGRQIFLNDLVQWVRNEARYGGI